MKVWIYHDFETGIITVYRSKGRASADIEAMENLYENIFELTYTLGEDYDLFEAEFIG